MVYVNDRGEIVGRPPFSWSSPVAIFWAVVNFFGLFFRTLVTPTSDDTNKRKGGSGPRFGGFSGGGGPGGGGGRRGGVGPPPMGMGGG